MKEKDMENLIAQHPDDFFPQSEFRLKGQQIKLGSCYADIVFEDKYNRTIIIELEKGILGREHIGKIIEYYGLMKKEQPEQSIELIICANTIPHERRNFLEKIGIECKEISESLINEVAKKYNYRFIDEPVRINAERKQVTVIPLPKDNINIVRSRYYQKASKLRKNPNARCYKIIDCLNRGLIKEGRINFLQLDGFHHWLGNCERAILEIEGNFILSDIIYKCLGNNKHNKNLIEEATLSKRK